MPEEVQDNYIELTSRHAFAHDIVNQVGEIVLDDQGVTDPTTDEVTQAGLDVFNQWPDANGIDIDPRYGLESVDGVLTPIDTNTSVAVGDIAKAGLARARPRVRRGPAAHPALRLSTPMTARPDGEGSPLEAFADQMRVLQRECAWKREQTHTSLIPYVREEAEEVVEAIESGDPAALCDELGDLLLQVVIHAVIAEEAGEFTLDDVARGVRAKMERRNPHVFGDAVATTVDEVMALYNAAKAAEKADRA